jgi:hypothetical protein
MKEQYIAMRNSRTLDLSVLYTFARERGMTLSFHEFQVGSQFLNYGEVIDHMDREFKLNILTDKDGNFIKVIE